MTRALVACLCVLCVGLGALVAPAGADDLMQRYQTGQQRAQQLHQRIGAADDRIANYQGSIDSLQSRLETIQASVSQREGELSAVTEQLAGARTRLGALRSSYARGRRVLAAQLRAQYEAPPPTVLNVVVDAHGFDALVNGLSDLERVRRANVATIHAVARARTAVAAQAARLADTRARERRATAAVLTERDQVAQLRLSIVRRQVGVREARSEDATQLTALRRTLTRQASVLDARAARARSASSGGAAIPPPGGCTNGPFAAHGGQFGFFQAPGTNYSVGSEPVLAARLDQLGRALHLHLSGISGYRSPQHSVDVGGFADDPHTRGQASDTPGVEGVSEATLNAFCLTRPFGGAAEADHIQLH